MTAAIVILNWNGQKYLEQFLPPLIKYTTLEGAEIIVADNASTDGSLAMLNEKFANIRTIILDKNYGFAGGYNKTLAQIQADYYILLNSDIEVTKNWLEPMISYLENNKDVAACQPKIRSYHQPNLFEHAGACGGFIDRFGFPFCRGRVFNNVEEDKGQYDTAMDIFWATGACLVIRAELYWKVGGLDNEFFAHMEEIDLCWRLRSRAHRIVCIPESIVYHIGGGTLGVENPHKTYLNFRNNLLLLYKNLPNHLLRKTMFWRYFFDYAAAFQFAVGGKFGNMRSVFKARHDYKKMRPHFEKKRKENILFSTSTQLAEIFQKSIVLQFYLLGKQTYTDLTTKHDYSKKRVRSK